MKSIIRGIASGLLIPALMLLLGCGSGAKQGAERPIATSPEVTPISQASGSQSVAASSEAIKFKLEGGSEAFALKPKEDGAKLVDANDKELARLNVDEGQKVKIKDAGDRVLGYVVPEENYWKIKNAEQTKELYILRRQDDGDYKLEDGANKEIYRIKKRDYGLEIETPTKQSLYKVKIKDDKTSLRDASDKTVLYTKSGIAPMAIASFGFDVLSREQKAALAYAVNRSGG